MGATANNFPLQGLRVIDLCEDKGAMCGRYLADLGAEVALIEGPTGNPSRLKPPLLDETSLYFATHHANKKSVLFDLASAADREQFLRLVAVADILIYSDSAASLQWRALADNRCETINPGLVMLSISDFGQTGPYKDYSGTNAVHLALAGVLARSGIMGREPLLPPGDLAYECADIQAAWVALLAYWQRLHTGVGGLMDFSVFEATAQILDPALGVTGSAAGGRSASQLTPRGRPPVGQLYPFFRCADGYVRVCVLNPRQWQAMSDWLGGDHPFREPEYAKLSKRFDHLHEINPLIAALFANQKADDLVTEGQRRGVPIAAVARPGDVLEDEHLAVRGMFKDMTPPRGRKGQVPVGYVKIDGVRVGIRRPAPSLGADTTSLPNAWLGACHSRAARDSAPSSHIRRPLQGLRVLDLGVIVAGAELGRLLSDQGAEVIKIESQSYPDGLRQSLDNAPMNESFAQGSRGKKSLGLNLRSDKGRALFKELVTKSDIVLSNFKPGTMDTLGLGYGVLKAINPSIIVAESSALGGSGPKSRTMGYGPLVRVTSGLAGLWRYPDDEGSFADATTIYPDHFAARVSAVAILALLIRRERTGEGGTVSLAQVEAILTAFSTYFLRESLQPGSLKPLGNRGEHDAPSGVFPCKGDDEWCVIDVRDTLDWLRLCEAIGRLDWAEDARFAAAEGRLRHCAELETALCDWTRGRSPRAVTEALQAVGVPAGSMQRISELVDDPHLRERRFFRINNQPGLPGPLLTENAPVGSSHLPEPDIRPAPFVAQHTQELIKNILGLSDSEIEELISTGDLEI